MIWKVQNSNLIVAVVLSLVYAIVTLLLVIGPLHMNSTGAMFQVSMETLYAVIYLGAALLINWALYFIFKRRAEILFFLLIISGILLIIGEIFMWGHFGP